MNYALGYGEIKGASLDVSFNEGKTWRKARLVQNGDHWIANIK